jgi:thioredoxin reductase/NAD-dependent dihydropyrimidine dehydrogenase PreA subunit
MQNSQMLDTLVAALVYIVPFFGGLMLFATARRKAAKRATAAWKDSQDAGLIEPTSLHPHIDLSLCCGSAACVTACPEKTVIGIVDGKAQLVDPTACIGHGACEAACPTHAITLVFGTERRGVELPIVSPEFETNVPGLFIAGELGGMGLIRNAITQGVQAIDAIARLPGMRRNDRLDVLIVGAGPAGFAASLAAKEAGLRFRTIEQETFGGTVSHFPRGKLVMTAPARLPIVGQMRFREVSKETLLAFWKDARERAAIELNYEEQLLGLERDGEGFVVQTSRGAYRTRAVLLAIGRRGTPRKLGVPGEDQSKVVYRLTDPEQFSGKRVLVVGGGDSALEAAATISEETDAIVDLSYRGDAFQRAKRRNRQRVEAAVASGRITVRLSSQILQIDKLSVKLATTASVVDLPNDSIIVCAGGVLPTDFLKSLGIATTTKHGEA